MKTFKVSKTLESYVINILKRRAINYVLNDNGTIDAEISGQKFHKIIVRAKMEKMTDEKKAPIPFIATTEVNDFLVMQEIGDIFIVDNKFENNSN